VNVVYGRSIPQLARAVRERVIERVENLTGLEVTKVNIQVNDVTCLKASSQLVSISARRLAKPGGLSASQPGVSRTRKLKC